MMDMEAQRRRVAVLCSHLYPSFNNYRNTHILSTSNCSSQSTSHHQIRDLVDNPNSHEDCVFCQIIRGNSSSFKLYEDDMCLCILDTSPLSRGHSLVIPKRHFHSLDATPPSVIIYSSPACPFPVDGMILLLAAFSELFRNTKSLCASIASLYPFPRSSQVIAAMCSKIPFISNAIKKATGCDSFNLLVNNGAAAGQVIFHTHIHIIPRKAHDRLWASESLRRLSLKLDQEAPHLAESIREQLLIENNKEECEDQGSVLAGKL